jgi:trimethylamine--corrinoid protein Co-methyltransferase
VNSSPIYQPRFSLFDRPACQRIHDASLAILQRTGVRVYHPTALDLLAQAGGAISDGNLVRLPPDVVESALSRAPARVTLHFRGSETVAAELSGTTVNFGPGSDCFHYLDPRTGRRRFTADDVAACLRLCDALPQIAFVMSMGIPGDLPLSLIHI